MRGSCPHQGQYPATQRNDDTVGPSGAYPENTDWFKISMSFNIMPQTTESST